MMRAFSTPLLAAILAAAVSPALAAPTPAPKAAAPAAAVTGPRTDLRCLMTMIALGQDKARAQAGQSGAYFFLGRLNARAPGFDLPAAMKAEAPMLGQAELQAELKRCGPMVAASSQSLQAAINGLRPPGAPAPTPGAAAPAAPAPAVPSPK
jgi:hypothetical protein